MTEVNTGSSEETSAVLFKQGSTVDDFARDSSSGNDVEKAGIHEPSPAPVVGDLKEKAIDLSEQDAVKGNVFSWHNLCYTVPVAAGQYRQLLDNVSGYVAPGKLTALMGESGAGKVRRSVIESYERLCDQYG